MTTTDPAPASMGEPLNEAELGDAELEWIRAAYAKSQTAVSGLVGDPTGPYAKDSGATAIRDVGRLLAEMDRRKAWLHDELRELFRDRDRKVNEARDEMYAADKKLAEATARVGVLEGQLATARALHKPERRYTPDDGESSYATYAEAADASFTGFGTPVSVTFFEVCSHCASIEMAEGCDHQYKESLWPCEDAVALGLDGGGSDAD